MKDNIEKDTENSKGASLLYSIKSLVLSWIKNWKNKTHTYHATIIQMVLWLLMLIVFIGFMLGFPYVLKFVYGKFATGEWWGKWWNDVPPILENGKTDDSLSVISNFLGGLLGIIIGFLFDLIFIEKIRKIKKYKFLALSVNREFSEILKYILSFVGDQETAMRNLMKDAKIAAKFSNNAIEFPVGLTINEHDKKFSINEDYLKDSAAKRNEDNLQCELNAVKEFCENCEELYRWGLNDIVKNAENDALFYKLPFMWKVFGNLEGKMTDCLHKINGCILRFNDPGYEDEKEKDLIYILIYIHKFFIYTGYKNSIGY